MELFWLKGYTATSLTELCGAMGINAPSLYAAFGSKEALYQSALAFYAERATPLIWGRLDEIPTARAAIADMLMASAAALPGGAKPAGCMVTLSNVGQEGEGRLGALVQKARSDGLALVAARIARAIAEGELPASVDAESLARFYTCVQQGMSIQARDGASRAELEAIARTAMAAWPGVTSPEEARSAPLAPLVR
ncbi:TetR family transcriptional regulator [Aquabacter spiritensis]|uniref:TetR family transcriptional regulator n=2 Tax=Aquabacter spiritensis TaxID=933073 RepID=A0A4V2UXY2_9HYPH|nr:TetR family transcriptional regulator [Aquabacter spiritensis]